jgi:ABC-2 type transport system ATP-binding protein
MTPVSNVHTAAGHDAMTPVLEFRDVARSFKRGVPVLNGVTFSVHEEEVVSLLGRNGAGKTTLVAIAMGMLFPDGGTVRVFGMSPTEHPVAVKRRIGYVGETQILPPAITIPELLAMHRHLYPTWDRALEKELLQRFGLEGNTKKLVQLSKGQIQQAALLCAVCHRPQLMLLDEPAAGLDPAARREFLETSISLLNREGTTILLSSHHMGDVERLGGRVVLLDEGRVRVDEPLDELREGYCVAVLPRYAIADSALIERVPGCLRVRAAFDDWHAVFKGTPSDVRATLHGALGLDDVSCTSVPLEELFVELVGGRSTAAHAG